MNDLVEIHEDEDGEGYVVDLIRRSVITLNDLVGRKIADIYFTEDGTIELELFEEEKDGT